VAIARPSRNSTGMMITPVPRAPWKPPTQIVNLNLITKVPKAEVQEQHAKGCGDRGDFGADAHLCEVRSLGGGCGNEPSGAVMQISLV
jgi:hypothetical protein